jgi:hypothetical protein
MPRHVRRRHIPIELRLCVPCAWKGHVVPARNDIWVCILIGTWVWILINCIRMPNFSSDLNFPQAYIGIWAPGF